ncbi:rho guanine nucleotide exchange factor 7-like isoform X3 [Ruditapes philippinarum]|uniref:rho guanine nucleotide exchange factor 7-like isoform X3 n=1 Tax=Ruditapes philippinarum TaxID=129788 RepID=UPI00295AF30E|nr:rho guanine nucleotide exchange factor 7-like isoform X3 [Ruditapes philippinarum]
MENYRKQNLKNHPSTEFSDEFVDIVNEINDFISVLEVRQKELAASTPKSEPQGSLRGSRQGSLERLSALEYYKTDSGAEYLSESSLCEDSRTNSKSDFRSDSQSNSRASSFSDLGRAFDEPPTAIENHYEPIANIFPTRITATATATASVIGPSSTPPKCATPPIAKPDLPPKPPGLLSMGEPGQPPKRVKSLFNFKGSNNDELCFSKGDIITVTQAIDGGWWEGTLHGKTGWFPSNYVREFKQACWHQLNVCPSKPVQTNISPTSVLTDHELTGSLKGGPGAIVTVNKTQEVPKHFRESMQYYHNVVLQNVIETERAHVAEMTSVLQNYIRPIITSEIMSSSEFSDLTGNLEDIITFQQNFLVSLEECSKHPAHQRRVGGVFMRHAPSLKELYTRYCANHPRAVAILQKNREELSKLMEKLGATPPGSMTLTTMLSKPFTRLDKYPSLLKELERHIEESHVDRGDTQRAIAVYRDIANHCMEIRKLKEMEHEIISSTIKGWEGEEILHLGEVNHLSQVKIETSTGEKLDRIFILFPNVLLMLSSSPRLSGYQYEGKLPLSGMKVSLCEADEAEDIHQFEISGPMIEKMLVTCGTKAEVNSWMDALKNHVVPNQSTQSKPVSIQVSTSQPSISTLTPAKTAKVSVTHAITSLTMSKTWSMSCLRPSPPLRPPLLYREDGMRSPRAGRKLGRRKPERTHSQDEYDKRYKKYDPRTNSEDALILKVIEAYCTSAKTRHTVNSSILYSPNVLIPQEEKIIVDDGGGPDMLQEKSLVDTVYSLRDQVKALEMDQKKMKKDLEDEAKARKSLENQLKKFMKSQQAMNIVNKDKEMEENHT